MFVAQQYADHPALGHRIDLDQPARHPLQHFPLELGRERRAGAIFMGQAAQVIIVKSLEIHQPLILHRHQHRVAGAVLLRQLQPALAVELAHQYQRSAIGNGRGEQSQRGVGIERRRQQRDLPRLAIAGRLADRRVIPAHLAAVDDALGRAGGAAGIDDIIGVFRSHAGIGRHRTLRRHPVRHQRRIVDSRVEHDMAECRQIFAAVQQLRALGAVDEQMHRATVPHHVGQLLRCRRCGQRRRTATGNNRPEIGQSIADGGGPEDRHCLPLCESVRLQLRRNPVDQSSGLGPAQLLLAVIERDPVGLVDGMSVDKVCEMAERLLEIAGGIDCCHGATVSAS